jgi:hypothetical protein
MTDFDTWSRENLVVFAQQSYAEILELRADLKAAIKAYREVITQEKEK